MGSKSSKNNSNNNNHNNHPATEPNRQHSPPGSSPPVNDVYPPSISHRRTTYEPNRREYDVARQRHSYGAPNGPPNWYSEQVNTSPDTNKQNGLHQQTSPAKQTKQSKKAKKGAQNGPKGNNPQAAATTAPTAAPNGQVIHTHPNDSGPQQAPGSKLFQLPRVVFDREGFIRQQRDKKHSLTSGDWNHDQVDSREPLYHQRKEQQQPSKVPEGKRRTESNPHQRGQSGRTSPTSRTGSEAVPISDAESQSLNSLAQDQEVVGFVQVLPSEPFQNWRNLHHHTPAEQTSQRQAIPKQESSVGKVDWLPERDY